MLGYVDSVFPRVIRGWAGDRRGRPVEIKVSVNGGRPERVTPNLPRPDVQAHLGQNAALGFEAQMPQAISAGDTVEVVGPGDKPLKNSPFTVTTVEGGKIEKALAGVHRGMKILEVGPSFSPIAPRSAGWNSFSLDHATQAELREKYQGQQFIELIEPVDFIWRGGPVTEAVPIELHGTFDVVIASHVIEHFPDPIGFYQSAAELLKEGGLISLVVPDKRYTFDFFKSVSMTSDLLSAHRHRSTRHTPKIAFDNAGYNAFDNGDVAWWPRQVGNFAFVGGLGELQRAKQVFDDTPEDEAAPYVDFHHTIYTPSTFELIILELSQLGVMPFMIDLRYPTNGCEFYVTLRKGPIKAMRPEALTAERLRLMKAAIFEQAEQARWLLSV